MEQRERGQYRGQKFSTKELGRRSMSQVSKQHMDRLEQSKESDGKASEGRRQKRRRAVEGSNSISSKFFMKWQKQKCMIYNLFRRHLLC